MFKELHRLTGREVEQAVGSGSEPLPQVFGIGQGGAQPNDARPLPALLLLRDGAHARCDDLHSEGGVFLQRLT